MRYFSVGHTAGCLAMEAVWAKDDALDRPRTRISMFFRGLTGQIWTETPGREADLEHALIATGATYTTTTERTDSDPFVEPFL